VFTTVINGLILYRCGVNTPDDQLIKNLNASVRILISINNNRWARRWKLQICLRVSVTILLLLFVSRYYSNNMICLTKQTINYIITRKRKFSDTEPENSLKLLQLRFVNISSLIFYYVACLTRHRSVNRWIASVRVAWIIPMCSYINIQWLFANCCYFNYSNTNSEL